MERLAATRTSSSYAAHARTQCFQRLRHVELNFVKRANCPAVNKRHWKLIVWSLVPQQAIRDLKVNTPRIRGCNSKIKSESYCMELVGCGTNAKFAS